MNFMKLNKNISKLVPLGRYRLGKDCLGSNSVEEALGTNVKECAEH